MWWKYDFRMVKINEYLDMTGIAFQEVKDKSIMIIALDFALSVKEN